MAGYFWKHLKMSMAKVSWKWLKVVVSMFQKFRIFVGFFKCFFGTNGLQIRKNIIASCLFRVHFS